MQQLHLILVRLTFPYTPPHTLYSNQHKHSQNQNKMYTKKMREDDRNQFPQSISSFISHKSLISCMKFWANFAKFVAHAPHSAWLSCWKVCFKLARRMQRLHMLLLRLTLSCTNPQTISSNQHKHTPNQNKMYTKKMRVDDMNQFP
jgi:hypothetical protein